MHLSGNPRLFRPDAVLSGVEARTSSPVRIVRNETLESPSLTGLYPCGEGAGYAGGITSAAMDGLKRQRKLQKIYEFFINSYTSVESCARMMGDSNQCIP